MNNPGIRMGREKASEEAGVLEEGVGVGGEGGEEVGKDGTVWKVHLLHKLARIIHTRFRVPHCGVLTAKLVILFNSVIESRLFAWNP